MKLNPTVLGKTFAALALAALAPTASASLIVNGDFQSGLLSPSTTSYTQSNTMYPELTWNIVSHDTIHPSWVDFYDHTRGDANGRYMIVNGATNAPGMAWRQTVSIVPSTDYELSGWFASLFPAAVATLQFRVFDGANGTPLASNSFTAPTELATWAERSLTFNSGLASSVAVEIWDTNGEFSGNDYAIDDIKLVAATGIPEPAAIGLLALVAAVGRRPRRC